MRNNYTSCRRDSRTHFAETAKTQHHIAVPATIQSCKTLVKLLRITVTSEIFASLTFKVYLQVTDRDQHSFSNWDFCVTDTVITDFWFLNANPRGFVYAMSQVTFSCEKNFCGTSRNKKVGGITRPIYRSHVYTFSMASHFISSHGELSELEVCLTTKTQWLPLYTIHRLHTLQLCPPSPWL